MAPKRERRLLLPSKTHEFGGGNQSTQVRPSSPSRGQHRLVFKFLDNGSQQVRIQLLCDVKRLTDSGRVNFRKGSSAKVNVG